jgi:hypothetical protein
MKWKPTSRLNQVQKAERTHSSGARCVGRFYVVPDSPPDTNITASLTKLLDAP